MNETTSRPRHGDGVAVGAAEVELDGDAVTAMASRIAPLDRRNTAQQIADRLVTAIALGEYVEGQRLPAERELAQMLGIGRPTIREALQRLASLGLVAIHRGRTGGAYVLPFEWSAAQDAVRRTLLPAWAEFEVLFDFRTLIERLVASTAAQRRTAPDVEAIRDALAAYRAAGNSREASRAADEALHRAIAEATHNAYLLELSAELRVKVSLGFQAEPYTPVLRQRALEQHPALVEAIVGGDAELAARLAEEHFGLTEAMFRQVYATVDDRDQGERP
jgi:GntR family transcriptional regulator, transcriptional repressor for pyruvate dehydrogenase complex